MSYAQTLQAYHALQVGDQVEITHDVKVGFRRWKTTSSGTVVRTARRAAQPPLSSECRRSRVSRSARAAPDDGQRTTVTLDEFTELKVLGRSCSGDDA